MDGRWNSQHYSNHQPPQHHYHHQHPNPGPPSSHPQHQMAISTVSGAESVMSMYPLASVTPVTHVARHLMTPTPPIPSFIRSSYSLNGALTLPPDQPPPYTELPDPLAVQNVPPSGTQQRQYWDHQQHQARTLLEQQRSQYQPQYAHPQQQRHAPPPQHHHQQYPPQSHHGYPAPRNWARPNLPSNAFAQSILQSAPYTSSSSSSYYPNPANQLPPLRNITPSSLSNALVEPIQHRPPPPPQQQQYNHYPQQQQQLPQPHYSQQQQHNSYSYSQQQQQNLPPPQAHHQPPPPQAHPLPPRPQYSAKDSGEFFDEFLTNTMRQVEAQAPPPPPVQQQQQQPPRPGPSSNPSIRLSPSSQKVYVEIPTFKPRTPPKPERLAVPESPDPLSMDMTKVGKPSMLTPQKRKYEEPLMSPTIKRLQSMEGVRAPPPQQSSKPKSNASGSTTPYRKMEAYVDIPPPPKNWTPLSALKGKHKSTPNPTPEGYRGRTGSVFSDVTKAEGSDDEMALGSTMKLSRGSTSTLKGSGIRTGERDDRGPLEKLKELAEDIFEAEDSLPADGEADNMNADQLSHFFSRLTMDYSNPLLSISTIAKLTKAIGHVARPTKRLRVSSRDGKANAPSYAGLAELEIPTLARMLKLLSRSVKLGEDLDPFVGPPATVVPTDVKPTKGKKKATSKKKPTSTDAGRSKSKTPAEGEEETAAPEDISEEDMEKLEKCLQTAKEAVLAADSCIALLSADKLPKQLYAEELITSCLTTIKNQFTKVIFPFTEALGDLHGQVSAILMYVVTEDDSAVRTCRQVIGEIFQSLCAVLPRINDLISRTDLAMSDTIIIQAIYIAIGPFFSVDFTADAKGGKGSFVLSALGGGAALRALRLSSLSLIRSIFAYYPDQRSWIIEEILSSLIQVPNLKSKSGQLKLRDGHSIHTISALLLQLVQTSAHDVRFQGQRFAKARRQLLHQTGQINEPTDGLLCEKDREEIAMYNAALDSSNNAAKSIVAFLTTRSGKGKATKSTKEADYRAIFDNLMQDLLTVLYWPEWPAASVLLGIATKYLISALDDVKSNTAAVDTNGAKSMALDHLGVIGARLRSTVLKQRQTSDGDDPLLTLDEVIGKSDFNQLERLIAAHDDVSSHLTKRSSEDQAYDSARELSTAVWGQELARALSRCDSILSKDAQQDFDEVGRDDPQLRKLAVTLKSTLQDIWKNGNSDVFDVGTEAEIARLDALSEELGGLQRFTLAHDAILAVILAALDAPVVFMRTKGLRALGQIIHADPAVLRKANVRQAIENHLHDQSPAVRDAAVELIGKYVVQSRELVGDYYPILSDRIADTGVAVRKRIIKLLKTMYEQSGDDSERQIDICTKLVSRMSDDDDGVKDLALKTLEELWLGELPRAGNQGAQSSSLEDGVTAQWTAEDRAKATACVIMGVAGRFGDRQSPLEDLFHQMATAKDKETSLVLSRYKDICDALINSLVDAQSYQGYNLVNCTKTIHLLVAAHPPMMSLSNARSLLPYLKNTTTKEDQTIADFILKIYSACIPHLPKTAVQFAQELQTVLGTRIQKPVNPMALPECIACFCAVIKHLTHDFQRLIGLLKSCNGRVLSIIAKPEAVQGQDLRKLVIIVFMISLLCEHFDYDGLRRDKSEFAADIDAVSKTSITDHVYGLLLKLYETFQEPAARGPFLRCLGYLFRAQPTLMTRPQSAAMMDAVFASDLEAKGRLLKIMQGFLVSESEKHAAVQKAKNPKAAKAINMDELVGNTDGFAESGVSSAIVQRYLPQILEAALSTQVQIQAVAVDILGFTIRQGLAHPLQCLPVIVALETSPNGNLSSRANGLHAILYSKHASLVNTRYMESARKSFEYQSEITKGAVQGYRSTPAPIALLHRWYSLVREKRPARQEFLKAILKCFDVDSAAPSSSQADVDFTRYMIENLSALDYKTQEEVLTVIKHATSVLSVAGMQILATWLPRVDDAMDTTTDNPSVQPDTPPFKGMDAGFARASVSVGMLLLLKAHLKAVYGISEDKCSKWVPGKKSALGDKPAVKRIPDAILTWERMPYARQPILVADDVSRQREQFLAAWEEDGVQPEPQDFDQE